MNQGNGTIPHSQVSASPERNHLMNDQFREDINEKVYGLEEVVDEISVRVERGLSEVSAIKEGFQ